MKPHTVDETTCAYDENIFVKNPLQKVPTVLFYKNDNVVVRVVGTTYSRWFHLYDKDTSISSAFPLKMQCENEGSYATKNIS